MTGEEEFRAELARLATVVEQQQIRIDELTGGRPAADPRDVPQPTHTSRRDLFKLGGAAAGAAGLAAISGLGRPQPADASFAITGGAPNTADHQTTLNAIGSFPDAAILRADATANANSGNIDGIRGLGAGAYTGVVGYGGPTNGSGIFGVGGGSSGPGVSGTGAGTGPGLTGTGGGSSGLGVDGKGGGPNGIGVSGQAVGTGDGVFGRGGSTQGAGVSGVGGYGGRGVLALGGASSGVGVAGGTGVEGRGGDGSDGVVGLGGAATGGLPAGYGVRGVGGPGGSGVYARGGGPGTGLVAQGGDSAGRGIYAAGGLGGVGLFASAGAGDALGIQAIGAGNAAGIQTQGGQTSGPGITGTGGSPNGRGSYFSGAGSGEGVFAQGGTSSGTGVSATGGSPDGLGGSFSGLGAGDGLLAQGGAGGGRGLSATGSGSGAGVRAQGGGSAGAGLVADGGSGGVSIVANTGTARSPLMITPATTPGSPSGTHAAGETWLDSNQTLWLCVTPGTPGTWAIVQTGGATTSAAGSFFTSVVTIQPTLVGSDGTTWTAMSGGPSLTIIPRTNCMAVISANADLFVGPPPLSGSLNQDLAIWISGDVYTGAASLVAWKENGGDAAYTPNAAFVQTLQPLAGGTTYIITLRWKTNVSAGGKTIYAGAGPLPGGAYSPTSLSALLIPTP